MQYKGDDLDLRVPQARSVRESYVTDYDSTANGRWSRPATTFGMGGEPLWVDEVLLACCNYAFDVAQANGAADVGLEHLVNALTRVDAAARILEARGVREGQLRRESAALIASEVPAANAGDAVAPRRSAELEDVLRRASDIAHRRSAPATVEDVLGVLMTYNRDLPVLHLLRRLATDWHRADWSRPRDVPVAEPVPRMMPVAAVDLSQHRLASLEDNLRLMQSEFAAERKLLMDLVRDIQRDVVAQRGDGAAFRGDLGQRLEGLERAMLTRPEPSRLPLQITERLSGLEKAVHGSLGEQARGLRDLGQRLVSLEGLLGETRSESGEDALAERMTTLEKAVHGGLGEGARNWAHLGQRLTALEAAVTNGRDGSQLDAIGQRIGALEKLIPSGLAEATRPLSAIVQRLAQIETAVSAGSTSAIPAGLGERLTAIERSVETAISAARSQVVPEALVQRLGAIERRLETGQGDTARSSTALVERVGDLHRAIDVVRSETSRIGNDVAERMAYMEAQLSEPRSAGEAPGRELADRIGGLERAVRSGFGDAAQTTGAIAERLMVVERGLAERPRDDGEALLILDERLGAIERVLETRGQQTLGATAEVLQRLSLIEQRPSAVPEADFAGLISPLGARLQSLEPTSLQRVESLQAGLADIVTRLGALDERMRAEAAVTEEALRGRDQDFDFIYNEIKQLGQSQATLNSAVNDWRNESQTHFGTLAGRLDKLHSGAVLPMEAAIDTRGEVSLPNGIRPVANGAAARDQAASVGTEGKAGDVTAHDYVLPAQPERSFWYWLFGTPSVARSNRESELKVARMRQNIREARDRRRTQA